MKIAKDKLLIFSFVSLIVLGWIIAYTQNNTESSRAAGANPVTISMSASQATAPAGQEVPVTFIIDTGDTTKKISGIDLTFTAGGNVSITDSTVPTFVGNTAITPTEFVKSITPTSARLSYAFLNNDSQLGSSVTFQVKIKGTAAGTGTLALDLTHSQVVGNIAANTFDMPTSLSPLTFTITGGTTTGTPTPTFVPGTPQINVHVSPTSGTQALNTPFNVSLLIDGQQAGQRISGVDIVLNADPSILQVVSVAEPVDEANSGTKFTKLVNSVDTATGKIQLNYAVIQPESSLPTLVKFAIQLKGIQNGSAGLNIQSAQIVGNITQNAYAVNTVSGLYTIGSGGPTATPVPSVTQVPTVTQGPTPTTNPNTTPTPIPTVSGSVILNLKLKLQGISRQPATQSNGMQVQVMIGKEGFMSAPQFGTFTADASGIWSGSVGFNDVTPGASYRIYIKGPKHLQKKFCESQPVETAAGTYRCSDGKITIAAGQNTFDFSKVYNLVGDLPIQNGVVDSYDTSYIKLNLGATDAKALQTADLNLDGIVDTQDYSLVIAALSIKYDEL